MTLRVGVMLTSWISILAIAWLTLLKIISVNQTSKFFFAFFCVVGLACALLDPSNQKRS